MSNLLKKLEIAKKNITMLSKKELIKHKSIVEDMIKDDDIHVIGLIGNNGRIDEKELIRNRQEIIQK